MHPYILLALLAGPQCLPFMHTEQGSPYSTVPKQKITAIRLVCKPEED
ncbi:hypothetical protein [Gluconobacter morbifer]|uniref:Uncharacterized protein n=1 Tax=Gluconobacter morbifer G707 TaxID=1088869 RepID=G6XIT1_9PROT|nr:hypothetical protein [Gluconobacter morbifer]EHH68257.1 hypothetical protein GMO_10270 [Gluconobacter morbifer G707]